MQKHRQGTVLRLVEYKGCCFRFPVMSVGCSYNKTSKMNKNTRPKGGVTEAHDQIPKG